VFRKRSTARSRIRYVDSDVVTVHVSKFVALAEPQLLVDRKARHAAVGDPAGPEASARIVKRTTVEVRLSPVAGIVEAHGVQVNPARLRSGQLDACGAPVRHAERHSYGDGIITLTAANDDGAILFGVHDEGQGIAPEFLSHAAERFRQDETSRTGPAAAWASPSSRPS